MISCKAQLKYLLERYQLMLPLRSLKIISFNMAPFVKWRYPWKTKLKASTKVMVSLITSIRYRPNWLLRTTLNTSLEPSGWYNKIDVRIAQPRNSTSPNFKAFESLKTLTSSPRHDFKNPKVKRPLRDSEFSQYKNNHTLIDLRKSVNRSWKAKLFFVK